MKIYRIMAIAIAAVAIVSCTSQGGGGGKESKEETAGNPDSAQVIKDYHGNGNLWHVKEAVNVNYGIEGSKPKWVLQGTVYEYYETPKNVLATKTEYKNGKKHGKAYKYYKSGKIYLEWDYENGRKEGFTKKYHESGYLVSEVPYKHNMLGLGSKEFNEAGEELTMPVLKVWSEDTRRKNVTYTIYATVENKYGNKVTSEFMNGMLINGQFSHPNLKKINSVTNKVAKLEFFESTGFPQYVSIVAKATTAKGTPVLLNKLVNLD